MENNYKNLIILGNGFDLHLGLPTRWSDFVEFYEIVKHEGLEIFSFIVTPEWSFEEFKKNGSKWSSNVNINSCLKDILNKIEDKDSKKLYISQVNSFLFKLNKCKILKLLSSLKNNNSEYLLFTWSDFEHLIENILDSVDEYTDNLINKSYSVEAGVYMNDLLRMAISKLEYNDAKYFNLKYQVSDFNIKTDVYNSKERFLDFLFNELMEFTSIFKDYINLIVDKIILNYLLDCKMVMDNTLIITFNYTLDIVLFNNFVGNIFFIHGKADKDIIIGVSNDQKREERIRFSKNYMRVYNRVSNTENKDVINQINLVISNNRFNNYYFLGHSIDKIDHSFLKKLYRENNLTKTTVFYYSKDDKDKKIFNLYLLLGEEYVIEMINRDNLKFIRFDEINNYSFN